MNKLIYDLEKYLINQEYALASVNSRIRDVKLFLNWLKEENNNYLEVQYSDILDYIKFSKSRGNKQSTISQKLKSIQLFYQFLEETNLIKYNPCEEIKLRSGIKKIPNNLLNWEELEELYQKIVAQNIEGKRNKVILSLILYQGLGSGAIQKLKVEGIDLENAKIYIPKTARGNSRTLDLKANQMFLIQQYITLVRPYILSVLNKESEQLLVGSTSDLNCYNILSSLVRKLRKINPKVTGIRQIRTSVITHWLSLYNIRQVQYMAGHRYVSSTEYYKVDKLESLQKQIENLHPLK